jgi:hypothetical protein
MKRPSASKSIYQETRPWIISRAELTAGLRLSTGDPRLTVIELQDYDIPKRRPSVGRIRGLRAVCEGKSGHTTLELVLKEPLGTTRAGLAGAGLREASFYRTLVDQLPVKVPWLMAADPDGEWLVLSLLSGGRHPEEWKAADYLFAIDQLVQLHDRFWGLGEDLKIFNWLARPLDSDLDIYVSAAASGIQRMLDSPKTNDITQDIDLIMTFNRLVKYANEIAEVLMQVPSTLIHGDYWPGNLYINNDGSLVVYDWQQAGIGPGILDLFNFIQMSLWWIESLPVATHELINRYRTRLAEINGQQWDDQQWSNLWDYTLLWSFLAGWIDLLATIPASVLQTRYSQLQSLWLEPVRLAVSRHLPDK